MDQSHSDAPIDIAYVCLSDLHLGADSSVLTDLQPDSLAIDTDRPSPVLVQFVACLRELLARNGSARKPTLILNGDLLEMALADTNQAAMVFQRFVELVFPENGEALFAPRIIYLPGNHDHHVWESARETQYLTYVSRLPVEASLEAPWHTTKMVDPDPVEEHLTTTVIRRYPHLRDIQVDVVYPNLALRSEDGRTCVIVSHGHYIESLYSLMSTLNTMIFPGHPAPKIVYDLEAENFAWIDFFWSTMGRSGDVGRDIGLLYDKLQDQEKLDQLIANLSRSLVEKYGHWRWAEGAETKGLEWVLDQTIGRGLVLEKHVSAEALSPSAQEGLRWYLEGPSFEQFRVENSGVIPDDVTFIFGHTHKPFQQELSFAGYPGPLKVYNSGGWIVDTVRPSPVYGAAVVLVDASLRTTSLRFYNQTEDGKGCAVSVQGCDSSDTPANPFHERIQSLVQPSDDPWRTFSHTVADAIQVREKVLQAKIDS